MEGICSHSLDPPGTPPPAQAVWQSKSISTEQNVDLRIQITPSTVACKKKKGKPKSLRCVSVKRPTNFRWTELIDNRISMFQGTEPAMVHIVIDIRRGAHPSLRDMSELSQSMGVPAELHPLVTDSDDRPSLFARFSESVVASPCPLDISITCSPVTMNHITIRWLSYQKISWILCI